MRQANSAFTVAAISVPVNSAENLVTVIEVKRRGGFKKEADEHSKQAAMHWLTRVKSDVTSAISTEHGLHVGDLVMVPPGSIPTTTSGKVRRAACAEQYRRDQFTRLDL
jgi:fatty acid CoA ligase FadD21